MPAEFQVVCGRMSKDFLAYNCCFRSLTPRLRLTRKLTMQTPMLRCLMDDWSIGYDSRKRDVDLEKVLPQTEQITVTKEQPSRKTESYIVTRLLKPALSKRLKGTLSKKINVDQIYHNMAQTNLTT